MTSAMESAQSEVAAQARPHAVGIVRLARAGYAAKGIVYLVIGGLAVKAALGSGGATTDSGGALSAIADSTAGRFLLLLMAIGLLGYALWAVLSAFLDAEDRGDDAKGVALRAGQVWRGLIYGALGVQAFLFFSRSQQQSSGSGAENWSARALELPWGRALVGAAGAGLIGYALYQLWRGARKNLRKRLRLGGADAHVIDGVVKLARFGIIARGVVFMVMGWFLVRVAMNANADDAAGIGESLATLGSQPYGRVLLGVVAAGLMAYGVWQLANARFREMRVG